MKLPEQINNELNQIIIDKYYPHGKSGKDKLFIRTLLISFYRDVVNHFNNLPPEWHPVSEKPEDECAVWLFDGDIVTFGIFVADVFAPIGGINEYRRTHWSYANVPQPPKE